MQLISQHCCIRGGGGGRGLGGREKGRPGLVRSGTGLGLGLGLGYFYFTPFRPPLFAPASQAIIAKRVKYKIIAILRVLSPTV